MLAFIILAILALIVLFYTGRRMKTSKEDDGKWTVFGTMGCGWTRKQLDYMKKNGKPHEFVDCDKGGCDGMKAYPTLKHPDGKTTTGYNEV